MAKICPDALNNLAAKFTLEEEEGFDILQAATTNLWTDEDVPENRREDYVSAVEYTAEKEFNCKIKKAMFLLVCHGSYCGKYNLCFNKSGE